jgi:hypothetical protein
LDRRLAETLPHRFKANKHKVEDLDEDEGDEDDTPEPPRRQTRQTVGGSGNSSQGGGVKKVTLSKERIQAIKDAGYWDNKPERDKMIRAYLQYDRANGAQGR